MPDVLVLAYHAVSRDWPAPLSVSVERFTAQMQLLASRGYRGITVSEAVHKPPPGRSVALTFDDAYRSVLDIAFPLLQRIRFPATVFVPTNFRTMMGRCRGRGSIAGFLAARTSMNFAAYPGRNCGRWPTRDGRSGLTPSHMRFLRSSRMSSSIASCANRGCAVSTSCQRECRSLAYRFGAHDDRVVRAAREAGFAIGCTVPDLLAASDPLRTPRVGIWHDDGKLAFDVKTSMLVRRARTTAVAERSLPFLRALLLRYPGRSTNDGGRRDHRRLGS